MAKQSVFERVLCWLGGDQYTRASTEAALQESLQAARRHIIRFDIHYDKWILLSDLHKGAKNGADDFRRSEGQYLTALDHYFQEGYSLCVMGDAEELWEEFPQPVLQNNHASFSAESRFHDEGRYLRLWGNHDEIWGDPGTVRRLLQPFYGNRPLAVPESILLEARDGDETLGSILLMHGHQGTQYEGRRNRLAKWVLHNLWRPLQVLTGLSCNTPAKDWHLRHDRDKIIYEWVVKQPGLVLIAGHTHAPVFESYSHRARLMLELAAARARMKALVEDWQGEERTRIDKLSSELETLENKISPEEREESEPLENPLPCYFNTGCCCFEDGDITGIEMSAGTIRLVRWPEDDGSPRRKVLQSGSLRKIFQALQH